MGRAVLASRKEKKIPDKPDPSAIGGARLSRLATQLVLGGQNCCSGAGREVRNLLTGYNAVFGYSFGPRVHGDEFWGRLSANLTSGAVF